MRMNHIMGGEHMACDSSPILLVSFPGGAKGGPGAGHYLLSGGMCVFKYLKMPALTPNFFFKLHVKRKKISSTPFLKDEKCVKKIAG